LPKLAHCAISPEVRDANAEQFVRLLIANEQALFNYAYSLLLNPEDTREVLQDSAVAMWQHLDEYDFSRPFFPWAARFAYFHVLNFRKRRRHQRLIFSDKTLEVLADDYAARQSELDDRSLALLQCIKKLPAPARTLIKSRYQRGWTVQEVAHRTGRSPHTLYKVLEKLQNTLLACVQRTLAEAEDRS
jgi:RNA polymerase sigma-70 factor (ECF subfamily)